MANKYLEKVAGLKDIHSFLKWHINGLGKEVSKKALPANSLEGVHEAIGSLLKAEGRHPATMANFRNSVKNIEDRKNNITKRASFKEVLTGKALQIAKDSRNLHASKAKTSSGIDKVKNKFSKKRFQKTLNKERMKTWGARAAVAAPVTAGGYYLHRKNTKNGK